MKVQRIRNILGRRVFIPQYSNVELFVFLVCKTLEDLEGGVAFSFLFCLCWKALVRMRKKRRAGVNCTSPVPGACR